jgi:hypothetical protein
MDDLDHVRMPPGVPLVPIEEVRPDTRNPRTHDPAQIEKLVSAIRAVGWTNPILADDSGRILAGHGRLMAAQQLGLEAVPVLRLRDLTDEQKALILLGDNRLAEDAGWDREALAALLREIEESGAGLAATGFGEDEIETILREAASLQLAAPAAVDGAADLQDATQAALDDAAGEGGAPAVPSGNGSLSARFGVPPFSVLNARDGWWQNRKRAWLALGIRSEVGRGGKLLNFSETVIAHIAGGPAKRALMSAAREAKA